MPFVENQPGEMTADEYLSMLTQEECDRLPAGTPIWFANVMHGLIPEKISVAAGQASKNWPKRRPSCFAKLSDFYETDLYNVGQGPTRQKVWLRKD